MYLDGYKYWLAYKKGAKSYFRCSRSKSQKCPGKVIMEDSKVITIIPHDHDKESRNNAVEKFRKVLTKKAIEKPNKSLVDIYLEETQNHSEASILYPFNQAESTMRKARGKSSQKGEKIEKKEVNQSGSGRNCQQHQKYFYVDSLNDKIKIILMNQGTLKVLGKIEELHIDCSMKVDVMDSGSDGGEESGRKKAENVVKITKNRRNFENVDKFENSVQFGIDPEKSRNVLLENVESPQINIENSKNDRSSSKNTVNYINSTKVDSNSPEFHRNSIQQPDISQFSCQPSKSPSEITLYANQSQQSPFIDQSFENFQFFDENGVKNSIDMEITFGTDDPDHNFSILNRKVINFEEGKETVENGNEMENLQSFVTNFQENSGLNGKFMEMIEEKRTFCKNDQEKTDNENFGFASSKKFEILTENWDNFGSINSRYPDLAPLTSNSSQSMESFPDFAENQVRKIPETKSQQKLIQAVPKLIFSSLNQQNLENAPKDPQIAPQRFPKTPQIPLKIHRYQIITVIALVKGRDCPIAFALLKSPTSNTFHDFLQFLNHKIQLFPSTILTNNNSIIQQSIQSVWPEATVKVMYFHYAQSVLNNLNRNCQKVSKNILELSSLKMILSMPLIPTNYVLPGWEALRKWMSEKNVDLGTACDDVYVQWLAENAEKISIFNGLTHSINNHVQVFQSELLNSFGTSLTGTDDLVDKICRQATKSFSKFTKTSESLAKKIQKLQKTVKIATKNWISSPFHLRRPIQFLQQVSHCIDDGMINFVMNFEGNFCKEPPPLLFYVGGEKMRGLVGKEAVMEKEPPPLVPIRR